MLTRTALQGVLCFCTVLFLTNLVEAESETLETKPEMVVEGGKQETDVKAQQKAAKKEEKIRVATEKKEQLQQETEKAKREVAGSTQKGTAERNKRMASVYKNALEKAQQNGSMYDENTYRQKMTKHQNKANKRALGG